MASASPKVSECKKHMDISNLMSPPEPPKLESFAHHANTNTVTNMPMSIDSIVSDPRRHLGSVVPPLSPPISPATKPDDHVMNGVATSAKDPILYPVHDVTSSPPQQPLFVPEEVLGESTDARQIVDGHVLARPAQLFRDSSPPKKEEYELVLSFRSQVMKLYQANPGKWLKREREQLYSDRRAQAQHRQFKLPRILPAAKPQPIRKEAQRVKTARVPKVTKPAAPAKATPTKPRPIRAGPGPGPSPATAATAAALAKPITRAPSSTPDPTPRRGTTQNRADDDFESIRDICPPLNSLDYKTGIIGSLKVEWKTGTTDLTKDPHRDLLHPEELHLASSLRLTCAVYLTSKRRIFLSRLTCLEKGKEFRKTDAQQACKIDVNKASKLWTAFDKIGWLEKAWVSQYVGTAVASS
ncbi:SWIRM domain-containing protein [Xylaria telfairii]|nr:SWIRM domain-containing protein [Xylaria telfairii]